MGWCRASFTLEFKPVNYSTSDATDTVDSRPPWLLNVWHWLEPAGRGDEVARAPKQHIMSTKIMDGMQQLTAFLAFLTIGSQLGRELFVYFVSSPQPL
jgi:hypothetical protein